MLARWQPSRGEPGQLRLLLALRWTMVREARTRRRIVIALSVIPALWAGAIIGGLLAPTDFQFNFALLAPTALASFASLAIISPASSAGGTELFPSDQLVAYPIRERTVFASTLLLAPLNLAWITTFGLVMGVVTYVSRPGPQLAFALLLVAVYAGAATIVGQAIAWWVEGLRQRRVGRILVRIVGLVGLAVLATVQLTHRLTDVLDALPTRKVAIAAIQSSQGRFGRWAVVLPVLLGIAAVSLPLGRAGCRWALNRVSDGGLAPEAKPVSRRTTARRPLFALMQVDRASVWRSAPLRRGALVMALLPGFIAAITRPHWDSLVLLTGLVAAGAGLLFGVNAFGMDGPGALTLEGLPVSPSLRFWAKTLTIMEFCGITTGLALAVGAIRADGRPTGAQVVALLASVAVCSLSVAAFSMRVSLRSPHRAELKGRRDTPAPPGAMIAYSARLAVRTTLVTLILSVVALAPWTWFPLAFAIPMACFAAMSLLRTSRAWQDVGIRSRVVTVVSAG
jgi:hypothetical protein